MDSNSFYRSLQMLFAQGLSGQDPQSSQRRNKTQFTVSKNEEPAATLGKRSLPPWCSTFSRSFGDIREGKCSKISAPSTQEKMEHSKSNGHSCGDLNETPAAASAKQTIPQDTLSTSISSTTMANTSVVSYSQVDSLVSVSKRSAINMQAPIDYAQLSSSKSEYSVTEEAKGPKLDANEYSDISGGIIVTPESVHEHPTGIETEDTEYKICLSSALVRPPRSGVETSTTSMTVKKEENKGSELESSVIIGDSAGNNHLVCLSDSLEIVPWPPYEVVPYVTQCISSQPATDEIVKYSATSCKSVKHGARRLMDVEPDGPLVTIDNGGSVSRYVPHSHTEITLPTRRPLQICDAPDASDCMITCIQPQGLQIKDAASASSETMPTNMDHVHDISPENECRVVPEGSNTSQNTWGESLVDPSKQQNGSELVQVKETVECPKAEVTTTNSFEMETVYQQIGARVFPSEHQFDVNNIEPRTGTSAGPKSHDPVQTETQFKTSLDEEHVFTDNLTKDCHENSGECGPISAAVSCTAFTGCRVETEKFDMPNIVEREKLAHGTANYLCGGSTKWISSSKIEYLRGGKNHEENTTFDESKSLAFVQEVGEDADDPCEISAAKMAERNWLRRRSKSTLPSALKKNRKQNNLGRVHFRKRNLPIESSRENIDEMLRHHPHKSLKLSEKTSSCITEWMAEISERDRKVEDCKFKAEVLVQSSKSLDELKSRAPTIRAYAQEIDVYGQPIDVDSNLILDSVLRGSAQDDSRQSGMEMKSTSYGMNSIRCIYGAQGTRKKRLKSIPLARSLPL